MSADNTIAIFETLDGKYRVGHVQNVERFSEPFDQKTLNYFNGFRLFNDTCVAWAHAEELLSEYGYVEYGIQRYSVNVSSTDMFVKKRVLQIQVFGGIKEKNGKTIRENNQEIKHKFAVGQAVLYREPGGGVKQAMVTSLNRDCYGTVLYTVRVEQHGIDENSLQDWNEWVREMLKVLANKKA